MTGRAILLKKYRLRQKYPPTSPKRVGTPLYKGEADGEVWRKDLPKDLPSLTPNPSPEGKRPTPNPSRREGRRKDRRKEKWGDIGEVFGEVFGEVLRKDLPKGNALYIGIPEGLGRYGGVFEKKKKGKRKKAKNESYAFG